WMALLLGDDVLMPSPPDISLLSPFLWGLSSASSGCAAAQRQPPRPLARPPWRALPLSASTRVSFTRYAPAPRAGPPVGADVVLQEACPPGASAKKGFWNSYPRQSCLVVIAIRCGVHCKSPRCASLPTSYNDK